MDELDKILNLDSKDVEDIVSSVLSDTHFNVKEEVQQALTYTRKVSINDIVPEPYQQKLMEIDYTMTQCFWLIGDITNDLINSVNRERANLLGKVVTKQDIFESVGFFCHRTGRSVRYYYECASYFPVAVRQKYDVPFTMFAEARWIKDWELFLTLASDNPMWSMERVRSEYDKLTGDVRKEQGAPKEVEVRDSGAELPLPEPGEQWEGAQGRFKAVLLGKLDHTVDDLRQVLDKIPLPTEYRVRIGNLILEIDDIMLGIRREV